MVIADVKSCETMQFMQPYNAAPFLLRLKWFSSLVLHACGQGRFNDHQNGLPLMFKVFRAVFEKARRTFEALVSRFFSERVHECCID